MSESGKVVVTKSKLDELANTINEKAGSTGPKTIAELVQTVNNIPSGAVVPTIGDNGNWYIDGEDRGTGHTDILLRGRGHAVRVLQDGG